MFKAGEVQILVAYSLLPINSKVSEIRFKYVDGGLDSAYPIDSIKDTYQLEKRQLGQAITIGLHYFVSDQLRTSLTLRPHFNSFLSNKNKNGQVYGVQFDLGADYILPLSKEVNLALGSSISRVIAGFGITSGGPKNKAYLMVDQNKLFDQDVGFHVIDRAWAIGPRMGLHVKAGQNIILFANTGFQFDFARRSRINIAGTLENGNVKWNRRGFSDQDLSLEVDGQRIQNGDEKNLPYRFSGLYVDLGAVVSLTKKK